MLRVFCNGGGSAGLLQDHLLEPSRVNGFLKDHSLETFQATPFDDVIFVIIESGHENDGQSWGDRKSTRLNSSHGYISYAVFCLKKKKMKNYQLKSTAAKSLYTGG